MLWNNTYYIKFIFWYFDLWLLGGYQPCKWNYDLILCTSGYAPRSLKGHLKLLWFNSTPSFSILDLSIHSSNYLSIYIREENFQTPSATLYELSIHSSNYLFYLSMTCSGSSLPSHPFSLRAMRRDFSNSFSFSVTWLVQFFWCRTSMSLDKQEQLCS